MTDTIAEIVREACAKVCERRANDMQLRVEALISQYSWQLKDRILLAEYEAMQEAFEQSAAAIRALPLPPDPRDAEIAELRRALMCMHEALRRHAIRPIRQWCVECGEDLDDTEHHAPGCLAAPEGAS